MCLHHYYIYSGCRCPDRSTTIFCQDYSLHTGKCIDNVVQHKYTQLYCPYHHVQAVKRILEKVSADEQRSGESLALLIQSTARRAKSRSIWDVGFEQDDEFVGRSHGTTLQPKKKSAIAAGKSPLSQELSPSDDERTIGATSSSSLDQTRFLPFMTEDEYGSPIEPRPIEEYPNLLNRPETPNPDRNRSNEPNENVPVVHDDNLGRDGVLQNSQSTKEGLLRRLSRRVSPSRRLKKLNIAAPIPFDPSATFDPRLENNGTSEDKSRSKPPKNSFFQRIMGEKKLSNVTKGDKPNPARSKPKGENDNVNGKEKH